MIEPVLGCVPRGIAPPCPACAEGRTGGCERVAFGHLAPGLQIGFCTDTGGGWSSGRPRGPRGAAPRRARRAVRRRRRDGRAHGLRRARRPRRRGRRRRHRGRARGGHARAVHRRRPGAISPTRDACSSGPSYAHQRRLAEELGADLVVEPDQLARAVRRRSRSLEASGTLTRRRRRRHRLRGQRRVPRRSPSPWCGPGAGSCSWACRAGSASTWPRCGTARSRSPAPTPTAPRTSAALLRRTFDIAMEVVRGQGPRPAGVGALPARALRGGARPRRRGRTAGRGEDRLRPARPGPPPGHAVASTKGPPHEPQARLRPRGRPLHPVRRCSGTARASGSSACRWGAGCCTRPSPSTPWPTPWAPSAHALDEPLGRRRAAAVAAARRACSSPSPSTTSRCRCPPCAAPTSASS